MVESYINIFMILDINVKASFKLLLFLQLKDTACATIT